MKLVLLLWGLVVCGGLPVLRSSAVDGGHVRMTTRRKPLPCTHFYEYCTNPNATFKFRTKLSGLKSPDFGPHQMYSETYRKTRCHCDGGCHRFGDCCYDKLNFDNKTGELTKLKYKRNIRWECHRVPIKTKRRPLDDIDLMLMVSCPSRYEDNNVIRRCRRHNVSSSQYHFSMDVPVVSLTTNRTYVNIYCAMCNNDTKIHPMNMSVYCPKAVPDCLKYKRTWVYVRGGNKWTFNQNNISYDVSYDLIIDTNDLSYYQKFKARRCRPEVIRYCPANWTNKKTRALCSVYSLLVRSNSNMKIYKNEHCAVCNGQLRSRNSLVCPMTPIIVPLVGGPMVVHSFDTLVDFHGDDVNNHCGDRKCRVGEICDPLLNECVSYT